MKNLYILLTILFCTSVLNAQKNNPDFSRSGEYHFEHAHCVSDSERKAVQKLAEENIAKYNIHLPKNKSMIIQYIWPVAQNPAFNFNSTYGVSNYVDHDPNFPDLVEDYNCGTQTYDTDSGYNHTGIDIFLWPFSQNQVHENQTWAVAAAAGTIIAKGDGNIDDNCTFNSNPANFVLLEHSDGSRSFYTHLKKHSLTSKGIGATVVVGEFLGVIASSGNSTGPHLHFECYDSGLALIDPYAGSCNSLNGVSYWVNQKPYWEPTINAALTHNGAPNFGSCPDMENKNLQDDFEQGEFIVFGGYYHDFLSTSNGFCFVYDPSGATWQSWVYSTTVDLRATFDLKGYFLPSNAMIGTWTFQIILDGIIVEKTFEVTSCNSTETLSGTQSSNLDIEANFLIESTQLITGSSTVVDYDSEKKISLLPGFKASSGTTFKAFLDGCGGQ